MSSIKPAKDTGTFPVLDTKDSVQAARDRLVQDIALLVLRSHRRKSIPGTQADRKKSSDQKIEIV